MIPKIIHYCWFGKNPLSDLAKKCIDSWKKYCPDYEIIEWNEENFDINSNVYVKEAYESKKWAFVTDYVRLYALDKCGGIYMDTDVELLKCIDSFLENEAFSGFETSESIPTAIMGSVKSGEWIKYLLSYYDDKHFIKPDGTLDVTTNVTTITNMTVEKYGVKLDNAYQEVRNVLTLYPRDYFCPKDYHTGLINLTDNTICIHHFNASWHSEEEKKNHQKYLYYVRKYGIEKANKKIVTYNLKYGYKKILKEKGIKYCFKKAIKKLLIFLTRKAYSENIILMESLNGLDGNTGAIYRYMKNNEQYNDFTFVWYVNNKEKFTGDKRTIFYNHSDKGVRKFLLNISAKYIMYDNIPISRGDASQKIFYLTHGCPSIKNVKGLINVPEYVDCCIATSENVIQNLTYQFSTIEEKFFVCGLPRNDDLFKNSDELSKLTQNRYPKKIMWMPTFRKASNSERNDSNKKFSLGIPLIENVNELTRINGCLQDNDILLIIKTHPYQDMSVIKVDPLSNIILLSQRELEEKDVELYPLLSQCDALLTDYSSVSFDFLLTDKPIGFVIDDVDDYKLGYAFDNILDYMPGHHIKTLEDMVAFFEDISQSKDIYKEERHRINNWANKYQDANNCERLVKMFDL